MNYRIFSDSSCDIPARLVEQHDITLVPFYVTFNQNEYFKENEEITNEEFYKTLTAEKVFPKTSLPSVQDYINKFKTALDNGEDCLCICLTHKFSGSFQSAMNAKSLLEEQYPSAKIIVIDSILATAAQGLLVLQAAQMKSDGFTLEDTVKRLNEIKSTARVMFTVDTLEYLAKGGRIGKAASLAGNMLNLKPTIQLKDGELIPYSNVRGRKKSLEKINDMMKEYFEVNGENPKDYDFCIAETNCAAESAAVQEKIEQFIGRKIEYPLFQIGVTIGTYTGPGVIGLCCIQKYK